MVVLKRAPPRRAVLHCFLGGFPQKGAPGLRRVGLLKRAAGVSGDGVPLGLFLETNALLARNNSGIVPRLNSALFAIVT